VLGNTVIFESSHPIEDPQGATVSGDRVTAVMNFDESPVTLVLEKHWSFVWCGTPSGGPHQDALPNNPVTASWPLEM
jgi:hypothetical protein